MLITLVLAVNSPCYCQDIPRTAANARNLVKEVYEKNKNVDNFQADIIIIRKNGFFMKGILPPFENINYTRPEGVISFRKEPWADNLLLHSRGATDHYYNFYSSNGYIFQLFPEYTDFMKERSEKSKPVKKNASGMEKMIEKISSTYRKNEAGRLIFRTNNPINHIFPLFAKKFDQKSKFFFLGEEKVDRYECYKIEVHSNLYGRFRVYISKNNPKRYVRRIDRLDLTRKMTSHAIYRDFVKLRGGGWLPRQVKVYSYGKEIMQATLFNEEGNLASHKVLGFTGKEKVKKKLDAPKKKEQVGIGAIIFFIFLGILILILIYLGVKTYLFQVIRPKFHDEVMLVDGRRPGEMIFSELSDLGILSVPFSLEEFTRERERLDMKSSILPRILVIAPNLAPKTRNYNYLIKAYVQDGGRVIIFAHDEESSKGLPYTPIYKKFVSTVHSYKLMLEKNWHKLFKRTTPQTFITHISGFNLQQMLVRTREPNVEEDPIVKLIASEDDINAYPMCFLREGQGEYLVIQYRFMEYLKNKKMEAEVTSILKDIFEHMMSEERRIDNSPEWIKVMFGGNYKAPPKG